MKNKKENNLVPGELKQGTYKELIVSRIPAKNRNERLVPNHIPSINKLKKLKVHKKDGMAINMQIDRFRELRKGRK